ncbi:hypothetical protein Tco_0528399 [Tanacetum coccineum]
MLSAFTKNFMLLHRVVYLTMINLDTSPTASCKSGRVGFSKTLHSEVFLEAVPLPWGRGVTVYISPPSYLAHAGLGTVIVDVVDSAFAGSPANMAKSKLFPSTSSGA